MFNFFKNKAERTPEGPQISSVAADQSPSLSESPVSQSKIDGLSELVTQHLLKIRQGEMFALLGQPVRNFEHAVVLESAIALIALREAHYSQPAAEKATREIIVFAIKRLVDNDSAPAAESIPLALQRAILQTAEANAAETSATTGWPPVIAEPMLRMLYGIPKEITFSSSPEYFQGCVAFTWEIAGNYVQAVEIACDKNR